MSRGNNSYEPHVGPFWGCCNPDPTSSPKTNNKTCNYPRIFRYRAYGNALAHPPRTLTACKVDGKPSTLNRASGFDLGLDGRHGKHFQTGIGKQSSGLGFEHERGLTASRTPNPVSIIKVPNSPATPKSLAVYELFL